MSFLQDKKCYLGGPIEHAGNDDWRTAPKRRIVEQFNIRLFDPCADPKQNWVPTLMKARETSDFRTMQHIAKQFVRKDLCIVDRADFGIWNLPYGVPTTGSHHEIVVASNAKKPTLLVCEKGRAYLPIWYYGFIPLEYMFDSWEDLYDYLDDVDHGAHMGDDRWAYIYGLL